MSKDNKHSKMDIENQLARLMEEIDKQGFENVDQINEFMKNMQGKSLDDLPMRTDKKGRSQDLVSEAHSLPTSKGKKLVKQALELDPNNVDAYNYLADLERDVDKALKLYKKAVEAAERSLGGEFFKENKGHFWGLIETRPYMRAKAGLAACYYAKEKADKAIEIYEELLELNPNDNQGVRYVLSTLLLGENNLSKYEVFVKTFDEDNAAWNFNNALYHFKKSGQSPKSDKALLKAYNSNKFVLDYLTGSKEMPHELPQYIGRGDESEAINYVANAWEIWMKTYGALRWINNFRSKHKRVN